MNILSKLTQLIVIFMSLLCGCSNGSFNDSTVEIDQTQVADFDLLFIGNSHSRVNGLPQLVETLIKTGVPDKSVKAQVAPASGFLVDRLAKG